MTILNRLKLVAVIGVGVFGAGLFLFAQPPICKNNLCNKTIDIEILAQLDQESKVDLNEEIRKFFEEEGLDEQFITGISENDENDWSDNPNKCEIELDQPSSNEFLASYKCSSEPCSLTFNNYFYSPGKSADITANGIVDDADLLQVLFNFANSCKQKRLIDDSVLLEILFNFGSQVTNHIGDLNGDGQVDDSDLLFALFNFGQEVDLNDPNCCLAADVNNDGTVDDADLLAVLFCFGSSEPNCLYAHSEKNCPITFTFKCLTPTPTPTPTVTPSVTVTPGSTKTPSVGATPGGALTPTAISTVFSLPTQTAQPSPTVTFTPPPQETPQIFPTPSPQPSPSPNITPTTTATITPTATQTVTPSPTQTPCNQPVDLCGVCGGDNSSCITCTSSDFTPQTRLLDLSLRSVRSQALNWLVFASDLRSIKRNSRVAREFSTVKNRIQKLFAVTWTFIWQNFPANVTQCSSSVVQCSSQSYLPLYNQVSKSGASIRKAVRALNSKYRYLLIRNKAKVVRLDKQLKKLDKAYQGLLNYIASLPSSSTTCP